MIIKSEKQVTVYFGLGTCVLVKPEPNDEYVMILESKFIVDEDNIQREYTHEFVKLWKNEKTLKSIAYLVESGVDILTLNVNGEKELILDFRKDTDGSSREKFVNWIEEMFKEKEE